MIIINEKITLMWAKVDKFYVGLAVYIGAIIAAVLALRAVGYIY